MIIDSKLIKEELILLKLIMIYIYVVLSFIACILLTLEAFIDMDDLWHRGNIAGETITAALIIFFLPAYILSICIKLIIATIETAIRISFPYEYPYRCLKDCCTIRYDVDDESDRIMLNKFREHEIKFTIGANFIAFDNEDEMEKAKKYIEKKEN